MKNDRKNGNLLFLDINHIKHKERKLRILYIILGVLVTWTLVRSVLRREFLNVFVCLLTYFLFSLPNFAEKHFNLRLPNVLEGLVLLFIFSAEILGEINCYYQKIPHWDTVLHTINGFVCAAIGFALLDIINRNAKIKFNLSPVYLALVAVCFSMTIGILWEFFEFGCDALFGLDMQKDTYVTKIHSTLLDDDKTNTAVKIDNIEKVIVEYENSDGSVSILVTDRYIDVGLFDTMEDLFVNFIGAVVFSVFGYFYIKQRGRGTIAEDFIPQIITPDGGETEKI